jgi:hypothetical protein
MVTALLLSLVLRLVQPAHPMHTSVVELRDSEGEISVRIRVFEDDFMAVLERQRPTEKPDSTMSRYVQARFALADRQSRPIRLRWETPERSGGVLLLQLQGSVPGGLAGTKVKSTLLCDRFPDQINIVRAIYGGQTATLLFTSGDGAKILP